ncbi:MAG: hypothetical protein WBE26_13375 [Phycisphaerae bacterium]
MSNKTQPFGAQFAEVCNNDQIPPVNEWSWTPADEANTALIVGSWPSRTCTNSCNDERDDETDDIMVTG